MRRTVSHGSSTPSWTRNYDAVTATLFVAAGLAVIGSAASYRQLIGWLYLFQLDEYLPARLWPTALRRLRAHLRSESALLAGALAFAVLSLTLSSGLRLVPLLAASTLPIFLWRPFAIRDSLKWTSRARRLGVVAGAVVLVILFLGFLAGPLGAVLMGLVDLLSLVGLTLAATILSPYEGRQRRRFMKRAEGRLSIASPTVVGITGSYGKTTTKVLLGQLLDEVDNPCFATPESFNTTLGVCRAINEGLRPQHTTAVLEMGAYRPGEIEEICSFTHPRVGIVTAIGLMHLERFGSRQRIAVAKSELLSSLPAEGLAVLPSTIAERATLVRHLKARLVLVGTPTDRWWIEEEKVTPAGTSFRLRGSQGEVLDALVPLYGRHLLSDLLCALAVALELGRPLPQLARKLAGLSGAPHRLQVSRNAGITIIDDAYNSNPEGAEEALRLLGSLPGERRVLVTPGYIELGPEQEQSMRDLGRMAAEVCTHVILVGPRHSAAVRSGLEDAGYPLDQVTVVADLAAAQERLPRVAGFGSVVLFENDLPDQYLERA